MSWIGYALLSAIFAAFTAILAKIGIKGVDSNLATAIRLSLVITIILAAIILKEKVTASIVLGGVLMAIGAILVGWGK